MKNLISSNKSLGSAFGKTNLVIEFTTSLRKPNQMHNFNSFPVHKLGNSKHANNGASKNAISLRHQEFGYNHINCICGNIRI